MRLSQQSGKTGKQKARIRTNIRNWRWGYRKSSECTNSSSWKTCAWNSRQLFEIVKSMTRKFQPRLQCI